MDKAKNCDFCDKKAQYVTKPGVYFCFGCALRRLNDYFSNPRNPIYESDSWEEYYKKI